MAPGNQGCRRGTLQKAQEEVKEEAPKVTKEVKEANGKEGSDNKENLPTSN